MGENEWRFGGICRERLRLVKTTGKGGPLERFTVRYKTNVFTPRYRKSRVFTRASKANLDFLKGRISAQEFSLSFA